MLASPKTRLSASSPSYHQAIVCGTADHRETLVRQAAPNARSRAPSLSSGEVAGVRYADRALCTAHVGPRNFKRYHVRVRTYSDDLATVDIPVFTCGDEYKVVAMAGARFQYLLPMEGIRGIELPRPR